MNIHPDMVPVTNIKMVNDNDRLFYELGYKLKLKLSFGSNWILTGKFKEIENVKEYIKGDTFLVNQDYLKHHNFMVIKIK